LGLADLDLPQQISQRPLVDAECFVGHIGSLMLPATGGGRLMSTCLMQQKNYWLS
jgi:hypothetical protein